MQEAANPRSPKIRNSSDITPAETKEARYATDTPRLKVTLEKPESLTALYSEVTPDTEKMETSSELTAQEAQALLKTLGEESEAPATIEALESRKTPDASEDGAVLGTQYESELPDSREIAHSATTWDFLKTPLLIMTSLACLLVAAWSYAYLQDTQGQLSSVTEAKVSVEKALADVQARLADVQARLAVEEKAVADFKAALAAAPALASEKQPTASTEAAANKRPQ